MATYGPTNLPSFLNNDADFRAWGSGIAAALAAVGLVQTADTGQVNWATVTKPAVTNTVAGYEIWRFNDALQATRPVFVKIEYGVAATVDRPEIWVTVGTTTNGAGTLGGQVRARTGSPSGASDSVGITKALYASGSSGRLHLMFNLSTTNSSYNLGLILERTKDATGADTGDGLTIIQISGSPAFTCLPLTPGAPVPTAVSYGPWVSPNNGNLSIIGLDIAVCPAIVFVGKAFFASVLLYNGPDVGALGTFVASLFGVNHTFMPMSANAMGGGWNMPGVGQGNGIAILWE